MRLATLYQNGSFYKGNLHSHSTVSDGKHPPAELCQMYREKGYSFLAITDHNIYGSHDELCTDDFITIPGTEVDRYYPDFRVDHLVCIGIEGKNTIPHGERFPRQMWTRDDAQEFVDWFGERGNMVFFAHPNGCKIDHHDVSRIEGLEGMEIFNSGCETILKCGLSESFYDNMLFLRRRTPHGTLPRCIASDDAHLESRDFFKGWVVVKAKALTRADITQALLDGSFYASRGPEIHDFYIEDGRAYFDCSPCRTIYLFSDGRDFGHFHMEDAGHLLTHAEFDVAGKKLPYLRAVCVNSEGYEAWSQPIELDKEDKK